MIGDMHPEKLSARELEYIRHAVKSHIPPDPFSAAAKYDGTTTIAKLLGHIAWLEQQLPSRDREDI
jgi:hypothetical protein